MVGNEYARTPLGPKRPRYPNRKLFYFLVGERTRSIRRRTAVAVVPGSTTSKAPSENA